MKTVRLVQLSIVVLIGLCLTGVIQTPSRVIAQTALTCGNVIETLQQSLAACTKTESGMICAGSVGVRLDMGDGSFTQLDSGQSRGWSAVKSIQTMPLDLNSRQWGTALLRATLQNADGNQLKQPALFMLYGDAQLGFEKSKATPPSIDSAFRCTATTTRASQVRAFPNTSGGVIDTLPTNEPLTLLGLSDDGNWVLTDGKTKAGWVSRSNLKSDCDLGKLAVVDPEKPATFGDFPNLILKADGTGTNACRDIPPAGLLVQSPVGRSVQFNLNGSLVTVTGSAVFMAKANNYLRGALISGTLDVQVNGKTQNVDEGQQVSIPLGKNAGLGAIGLPSKPIALNEFRGDNAIYLNTLCALNKPFDGGLPCRIVRAIPPSAVPAPTSGTSPTIP